MGHLATMSNSNARCFRVALSYVRLVFDSFYGTPCSVLWVFQDYFETTLRLFYDDLKTTSRLRQAYLKTPSKVQ